MTAIVIRHPERAWPFDWEQGPLVDAHAHEWQSVYVETTPGRFVEVDRCKQCHTPRCSRYDSLNTQCLGRRHHRDLHVFESGTWEPIGGYLLPEDSEGGGPRSAGLPTSSPTLGPKSGDSQ